MTPAYWISLELSDDQNHEKAQSHWSLLDIENSRLITTTYILDEAVTFLSSRSAHRNAVQLGESILLSPRIELVHVAEDLFFEGWELFRKYDDKKFSLTDCISFAVMSGRGLDTALSFDADFARAGYQIEPS